MAEKTEEYDYHVSWYSGAMLVHTTHIPADMVAAEMMINTSHTVDIQQLKDGVKLLILFGLFYV